MSIKDDNKIPAFKKKLREIRKKKIEVGILGDAFLALVGASNEFGAKIPISPAIRGLFAAKGFPLKKSTTVFIIPERSFIRSAFDDKKNIDKIRKLAQDIYSVDMSLDRVLNAIGIFMTNAIQKKIRSNIKPANHPFTVQEKKGKNKTLINNSRLLQGITHKIANA